jgi:hypothetical protein
MVERTLGHAGGGQDFVQAHTGEALADDDALAGFENVLAGVVVACVHGEMVSAKLDRSSRKSSPYFPGLPKHLANSLESPYHRSFPGVSIDHAAPASPLTDSRQLVRVLAADWNSPHAVLQRYTRTQAAAAWQPGDALPVMLGRAGWPGAGAAPGIRQSRPHQVRRRRLRASRHFCDHRPVRDRDPPDSSRNRQLALPVRQRRPEVRR